MWRRRNASPAGPRTNPRRFTCWWRIRLNCRYPVLFGNNPRLVASNTVQALRVHLTDVGAWLSFARR